MNRPVAPLLTATVLAVALGSCGADCPLPEHASQVDVSSGASQRMTPHAPATTAAAPLAPLDYTRAVVGAESFDAAVDKVKTALGGQGFGIVSEMDFAGAMKEKLAVEMRPYKILGACNPALAHKIVSADPTLGLLLPCKVVVYQGADDTFYVSFARPTTILGLAGPDGPQDVAAEVDGLIKAAFDAL